MAKSPAGVAQAHCGSGELSGRDQISVTACRANARTSARSAS